MKSHDLARLLLELPNLPIATHAHNHTFSSIGDRFAHGDCKVGLLAHYSGDHIIIGDFQANYRNGDNWKVVSNFVNGDGEKP